MTRPTLRVLAVLELLQSHGSHQRPGSGARIGVDGRTLRHYITLLRGTRHPDRGRARPLRRLCAACPASSCRRSMFTDDEALALDAGACWPRAVWAWPKPRRRSRARRPSCERVMPHALKRRLRAIDETVALDLRDATPRPRTTLHLVTLSTAAQARQRVHLRYRSGDSGHGAGFDPYGLVWRGGRWYAVGHCHLRGDVRSFRLDRVIDVHALPASFGRPDGFDALEHLRARWRPCHGRTQLRCSCTPTSTAHGGKLRCHRGIHPEATPCGCRRRRTTSTGSRANSRGCLSISACCATGAASSGEASIGAAAAPGGNIFPNVKASAVGPRSRRS